MNWVRAKVSRDTDLIQDRWYRVLPDPQAKVFDLLRIVDESGEDYLYPQDLFDLTPCENFTTEDAGVDF